MLIFGLDVPLQDFMFIAVFIFLAGRWYVLRLVNVNAVKALYITKDGLEGRIFPAEESISENRISWWKPKGMLSKPDKSNIKRKSSAINLYTGSRREVLYKIVEGDAATSDWVGRKVSGAPSLMYEEASAAATAYRGIGAGGRPNWGDRLTYFFLGGSLFAFIMLLLRLLKVF